MHLQQAFQVNALVAYSYTNMRSRETRVHEPVYNLEYIARAPLELGVTRIPALKASPRPLVAARSKRSPPLHPEHPNMEI